jgi:hypothetical protein
MSLTEDKQREKDIRMKKILRIAAEAEISVETVTRWFEMYEFIVKIPNIIKNLFKNKTNKS